VGIYADYFADEEVVKALKSVMALMHHTN
jgi:hypothetical protein